MQLFELCQLLKVRLVCMFKKRIPLLPSGVQWPNCSSLVSKLQPLDHLSNTVTIAHMTNMADHVTSMVAHMTNMAAHVTSIVAHMTSMVAHMTNMAAHVTIAW